MPGTHDIPTQHVVLRGAGSEGPPCILRTHTIPHGCFSNDGHLAIELANPRQQSTQAIFDLRRGLYDIPLDGTLHVTLQTLVTENGTQIHSETVLIDLVDPNVAEFRFSVSLPPLAMAMIKVEPVVEQANS